MTHIIRQQFLQVEVNGLESDGLALQRRLPDVCHYWLTPALERVLDRYVSPQEHLYIERLEIDAGTLSLERLEQDLTESVANAIEKLLANLSTTKESLPTLVSGKVEHKTEQQSIHEAFIYFLKTGSLPWSFRLPAETRLEQVLLNSWQEPAAQSDASLGYEAEAILQALASTNVRQCLLRQFSPRFLSIFISRFSPDSKKAIEAVLLVLRNSDISPVVAKHFEKQLWETALTLLAAGNPITELQLVTETWHALPVSLVQQAALINWLEHEWPGAIADVPMQKPSGNAKIPGAPESSLPDRERESPEVETSQVETPETKAPQIKTPETKAPQVATPHQAEASQTVETLQVESPQIETVQVEAPEVKAPEVKAPQTAVPEKQQLPSTQTDEKILSLLQQPVTKTPVVPPAFTAEVQEKSSRKIPEKHLVQHPEIGEGIYIENAGLVLLHPFLPRFFAALGIADEENILQPDRALCLLHYLATGQTDAPEYELILPKILCEIALETPVESSVELTEAETEEVSALLEAVIRHWDVLQNTSPDGLRGTFFLRSGKVSLRDDGDWLLQVEAKSFDILLDHLPWSISIIRLPWMSRMLWVEWA